MRWPDWGWTIVVACANVAALVWGGIVYSITADVTGSPWKYVATIVAVLFVQAWVITNMAAVTEDAARHARSEREFRRSHHWREIRDSLSRNEAEHVTDAEDAIHPNPFLNEPTMRDFFDDRLGKSTRRWEELYGSVLALDNDLRDALSFMSRDLADASANGDLNDRSPEAAYAIGWAGYCWRLAEEQAHGPPREHYEAALHAVWDAFPEHPPRDSVMRNRQLFWGANQVACSVQPHMTPAGGVDFEIWQGCPRGNKLVDFEYFHAGFDHARNRVVPNDMVATPDLWFAWCFGVGLRDFERLLAQQA